MIAVTAITVTTGVLVMTAAPCQVVLLRVENVPVFPQYPSEHNRSADAEKDDDGEHQPKHAKPQRVVAFDAVVRHKLDSFCPRLGLENLAAEELEGEPGNGGMHEEDQNDRVTELTSCHFLPHCPVSDVAKRHNPRSTGGKCGK